MRSGDMLCVSSAPGDHDDQWELAWSKSIFKGSQGRSSTHSELMALLDAFNCALELFQFSHSDVSNKRGSYVTSLSKPFKRTTLEVSPDRPPKRFRGQDAF